jgi:8-oxo-dGTP pyrophosphatase MutT (NUDIX family)
MTRCEIQLPWLGPVAISEFGTVMDEDRCFGLGAVLIIERSRTQEVLLVRKSARPGFAGNDQFAFPGGMVRPHGTHTNVSDWICHSLQERVSAEVNLDLSHYPPMTMLVVTPPIVAAYTARGRRRHTAIIPFCLTVRSDFQPCAQDSTVYDPGWRDLRDVWSEITPTNRLIAAQYVWPRLTEQERLSAQPSVTEALGIVSQ